MNIEIVVQAMLSLACLTYLYKENRFFRFAEYTIIGSAIGYTAAIGIKTIHGIAIIPLSKSMEFGVVLPSIIGILLGLLLFTRFLPISNVYMANAYRWGLAILGGTTLGLAGSKTISSEILGQIKSTISLPLNLSPLQTISNLIIIVGVIAVVYRFTFSWEQKGPLKNFARIGESVIYITLGSQYSAMILSRLPKLTNRLEFLVSYSEALYSIPIFVVLFILVEFYDRKKERSEQK